MRLAWVCVGGHGCVGGGGAGGGGSDGGALWMGGSGCGVGGFAGGDGGGFVGGVGGTTCDCCDSAHFMTFLRLVVSITSPSLGLADDIHNTLIP